MSEREETNVFLDVEIVIDQFHDWPKVRVKKVEVSNGP